MLIWATVFMSGLAGFGALAYDISRARMAKVELQAASDAAALNASNGLVNGTYVAKAQAAAAENRCDGTSVTLLASDVVSGYWSGTAFTPNSTPVNAVRVSPERTSARGNPIQSVIGNLLGQPAVDVRARTTVALITLSAYEWATVNSMSLSSPSAGNFVTAYDATNGAAGQTQATLKSDGAVALDGPGTVNANVRYRSTTSQTNGVQITGSIAQSSTVSTYVPGSQVANINGATWSAAGSMYFSSTTTVPGGTYVLKDFVASNCNVTFTGPTTIVLEGNLSLSNSAISTFGGLPKNLKIIATKPGSTINITNPVTPLVADFYAPGSNVTLTSASGYKGLRGRGVFNSLTVGGPGASLWYDRSMAATSESRKAVVVQ